MTPRGPRVHMQHIETICQKRLPSLRPNYTFHTYCCGLNVSVGVKYRGPLHFVCGLRIRVVFKYCTMYTQTWNDKMFYRVLIFGMMFKLYRILSRKHWFFNPNLEHVILWAQKWVKKFTLTQIIMVCQGYSGLHNNRYEMRGWNQHSNGIGSSSINKSTACPIDRVREMLIILEKDPWMDGGNPKF